jgi:hypothetical protein
MTNRDLENVLNTLGREPVPHHAAVLADELTQKFSGSLASSRPEPKWRHIMKAKLFRYAAAAAILIAAGLVVLTLNHAQPAWAIEQTIQALSNIDSVYLSGILYNGEEFQRIKIWAKANKDYSHSGDCRWEQVDGELKTSISIAKENENITYDYDPKQNAVKIENGIHTMIGIWGKDIASFMNRFKELGAWKEIYEVDKKTGRSYVSIYCKNLNQPSSYWAQIDLETKLPVRGKEWKNSNWEGEPWLNYKEVIFNPELPAGIFDFVIPEGAKVIDERAKKPQN